MLEAFAVFQSLTIIPQFQRVPIILILSKSDVFEEKQRKIPISDVFQDYEGASDYWKACQ